MLLWRYLLPSSLALLGFIAAFQAGQKSISNPPKLPPTVEPSVKPFYRGIAAAGIIEAVRENVLVNAPMNGIVASVNVHVWQLVDQGEVLFTLDDRELKAEQGVLDAKVEIKEAHVNKLSPQLKRLEGVSDKRAISQDELTTKQDELKVAQAEFKEAKAQLERNSLLLERLQVRSPISGTVIQKNIKPGEYLTVTGEVPIIVGDISELQIRADIDEQNASHFLPGSPAVAYPKNQPSLAIPLVFERIEPVVVPKISLTGLGGERVDTRVLQVIYTFQPPDNFPLYVGQQVDLYVESK